MQYRYSCSPNLLKSLKWWPDASSIDPCTPVSVLFRWTLQVKKNHSCTVVLCAAWTPTSSGYTWCTFEISFYISLLHYVIWIDIWIWQWLNVFHVPVFVLVEMRNGDKMYVLPSIFDNYSHKYIYNSKKVCEVIANFSCNLCWWKKKTIPANCYQHK